MPDFTPIDMTDEASWKAYEEEQNRKREAEKSLLTLPGLGFWVPPLVDVFIGNSAYVWYRLLQFTGDCDLDIERYDGASIGEPQTWFEEYEDASNFWYDLTGSRYDGTRGLSWGFEEGIAPGTPFLIQFGPPHWYRCSYEYNEYDVEYDYDIVRVMPRDPMKGLRSFARAFALKKKHDTRVAKERAQLRAVQRSDLKAMIIEQDLYYINGGYTSWERPEGKRVELCSTHVKLPWKKYGPYGGRVQLGIEGKHPESWDKALEELYVKAEKELGFTKEQLTQLPKKWRN